MNLTPQQQGQALAQAAVKYQVPVDVLTGIYGQETGFGSNVATSSAGAVGAFQFLPSTAKSYAYPLTNSPSAAQFQAQADSAAHYLSDLFHQTGSWNAAVQHYSGGGYGLDQLRSQWASAPKTLANAALLWIGQNVLNSNSPTFGVFGFGPGAPTGTTPPGATATGPTSGPNIGGALGQIADLLTSGQFWLRIGEALAGIILIAMGLRSLTGSTTTPVTLVRKAARG